MTKNIPTQDQLSQILVKNYMIYKLLAKPQLEAVSEQQMIKNFTQLILSTDRSVYQTAPAVPDEGPKRSQKTAINSIGITPKQAKTLKSFVEASLL